MKVKSERCNTDMLISVSSKPWFTKWGACEDTAQTRTKYRLTHCTITYWFTVTMDSVFVLTFIYFFVKCYKVVNITVSLRRKQQKSKGNQQLLINHGDSVRTIYDTRHGSSFYIYIHINTEVTMWLIHTGQSSILSLKEPWRQAHSSPSASVRLQGEGSFLLHSVFRNILVLWLVFLVTFFFLVLILVLRRGALFICICSGNSKDNLFIAVTHHRGLPPLQNRGRAHWCGVLWQEKTPVTMDTAAGHGQVLVLINIKRCPIKSAAA